MASTQVGDSIVPFTEPAGATDPVALIARQVAGPAADSVDREERFPSESFDALRRARLLSALIPQRFGGMGCSMTRIADMCETLGRECANTAMVFAMHQIQVACVVRHANGAPFFESYMREIADRQLLLASATSEVSIGGDVRTSLCAVERTDDSFALRKQAPVISYGDQADDILVTARRHGESAPSDQVMVVARKDGTTLERTAEWHAMGFRGTCSCGNILTTTGSVDQILPDGYDEISGRTMLPVSHILWASLWLGIATDAVNRARQFVRDAARKKPGTMPPGAVRLAELVALLQVMRSNVEQAKSTFEGIYDDADALTGIGFALMMNNLKIQSSKLVVEIVAQALGVCGIYGYKTDSKYSVERHLRDAYGAGIMINNDRILGASAQMLLVHRD
ncbi:MAG: acyl-CoA dehydrogenase family protein [bacterium]